MPDRPETSIDVLEDRGQRHVIRSRESDEPMAFVEERDEADAWAELLSAGCPCYVHDREVRE